METEELMFRELAMADTIVTEENSLQSRVISHCKQEMISSIVIGSFTGILGCGGLLYGIAIAEAEDGLKLLANFLGLGFLSISSLFFLRTLIRWLLVKAVRRKKFELLLWTVGAAAILDILIMLISLAVIWWTGVFNWIILIAFSLILDIWRFKTIIQFAIQCRKNSAVV